MIWQGHSIDEILANTHLIILFNNIIKKWNKNYNV